LEKPERRALLVGINDYPDPENRLEGCVNDVFLMSSVLQESGFNPENIRVVLNERATAAGILERLEWLLEGAEAGDERVFYYSGHGAQIPGYGVGEKIDHLDECLVAYDFDWSRATSVTDDQFYDLYSQLPYETHFVAVLDCCHAGGMTRDSGLRVRGLTPPDDIRHRMMKWNATEGMWETRALGPANEDAAKWKNKTGADKQAMVGNSGVTRRIGRAVPLRSLDRVLERHFAGLDGGSDFWENELAKNGEQDQEDDERPEHEPAVGRQKIPRLRGLFRRCSRLLQECEDENWHDYVVV
jgi:hypothetical protein